MRASVLLPGATFLQPLHTIQICDCSLEEDSDPAALISSNYSQVRYAMSVSLDAEEQEWEVVRSLAEFLHLQSAL